MKKYFFIFTIAVLFLLVSCSDLICEEKDIGKVHIVSIGINYLGTKNVGEQKAKQLEVCPCDALDFANWMQTIYTSRNIKCETHLLISEKSNALYSNMENKVNEMMTEPANLSGFNIIKTIKELNTDKSDLIVLYYSGHGINQNGIPMLITLSSSDTNTAEATTTSDIIYALAEKNCRSVVILDCCKNGSDFENGSGNNSVTMFSSLLKKLNTGKVSVIASCSELEDSNTETFIGSEDYTQGKHSLFTEILLDSLGYKDKIIPSQKTVNQLFNDLKKKGSSVWNNAMQNPEMNFSELDTVIIPK